MSGYLADCHLHSRVSPDAVPTQAEIAAAAAAAGLDEICFTEHADFASTWLGWRYTRARFRWKDLTAAFAEAEAAAGDRLRLGLGVELGDTFCDPAGAEAFLASAPPLDFIIGSIHVLSERMKYRDLSGMVPKDESRALAAMEDYLSLVRDLAETGTYSVLGHLTLPLRYFNGRRGFSLSFDAYEEEIAEILRTVIRRGRGIEVNTNRGRGDPVPDGRWLRLYRDLGGEIVTIGSDSHAAETVGAGVEACRDLLKDCGFRAFCTFRRMEPVFHKL